MDSGDQVIEVNQDQDQEEEKGNGEEDEIDSEKDETAIVPNAIDESDTMLETQVEIHIRINNSNHLLYPCLINNIRLLIRLGRQHCIFYRTYPVCALYIDPLVQEGRHLVRPSFLRCCK